MALTMVRWCMFCLGFLGGFVMAMIYLNISAHQTVFFARDLRSEMPQVQPPQFEKSDDFCREIPALDHLTITVLDRLLRQFSHSNCSTCRGIQARFHGIFTLTIRVSDLQLEPDTFRDKMASWLGNKPVLLNEAEHQHVVFIRNVHTMEETIINTLREKRPTVIPLVPEYKYVESLANETKHSCDLCNYTKATAADSFGRITSVFSYTASNAFKLDTLHTMVIFRNHHPHHWSRHEYMDVFKTAKLWFHKAFQENPAECYPQILWDLMPRASASQVHPHIHLTLNSHGYYGEFEKWQQVGEQYARKNIGANYYDDLFTLHHDLHLAAKHQSAVIIVHLTPRKENELVIMGPAMNEDFLQLLYYVIRVFIEDMGKLCFSCAVALPPMDGRETHMPAIARIVTRGTIHEIRSDISSLELFGASNVNLDPFAVARKILPAIQKRAKADRKMVHIF